MKKGSLQSARDPIIRGSLNALQRAALRARETAVRTQTDLIVERDGRVERITPIELTAAEPDEPEDPQELATESTSKTI